MNKCYNCGREIYKHSGLFATIKLCGKCWDSIRIGATILHTYPYPIPFEDLGMKDAN